MNKVDIVRAWKDATYRDSLSSEELASVPANPASSIELSTVAIKGNPETFSAGGSAICTPCPPLQCY